MGLDLFVCPTRQQIRNIGQALHLRRGKMGRSKAMSRVEQLLESTREESMRIDDLIDLFVEKDFNTGTADKTASIEKNLESISKKSNQSSRLFGAYLGNIRR